MPIDIAELNDTNCKTYLLCVGSDAIIVDPVRERIETYRMVLAQRSLHLQLVLETHTHADHLMLSRMIKESLGVPVVMHESSPSPLVDRHVVDGDVLQLGGQEIRVLHTPGHTPDSVCYAMAGAVLTGDTMLIGGSGRTDFPGGDAGAQYDGVVGKLFTLPDDTTVYPGHDYRGNTTSTIGEQKQSNPRFAGVTREQYIDIMNNLGLPFPQRIQQALQVNQSGVEADEVMFASVAAIAAAPAVAAAELHALLGRAGAPVVLDVREPEEFVSSLGHVRGALLVPLDTLEQRLPKLAGYVEQQVVVVCRAGARSASACAMLSRAGFKSVKNLTGGMLAWVAAELPVEH